MAKTKVKPKAKRPSPQIWRFYALEGSKLSRLRRACPRCGRGVFMAEHEDRYACGKCGYTEFKEGIRA
jgi:small subunit ribosomal protein S27Ae